MKNEMDALRMDEFQRQCWLRANRSTLMLVGLIWLGMIAWEVAHGKMPWFLVMTVPTIAFVRSLFYFLYMKKG